MINQHLDWGGVVAWDAVDLLREEDHWFFRVDEYLEEGWVGVTDSDLVYYELLFLHLHNMHTRQRIQLRGNPKTAQLIPNLRINHLGHSRKIITQNPKLSLAGEPHLN